MDFILTGISKNPISITPNFTITDFKCQGLMLDKSTIDLNGGKLGAGVYDDYMMIS